MRDSAQTSLQVGRALLTRVLADPSVLVRLPPRDIDLAIRLARRAGVLGTVACGAQEGGILDTLPQVVADQLQSAMVEVEARQRAALWELDRIAWALRDLGPIPIVALKGCGYLLAGMPNARGRLFADVDLLVRESDLSAVEAQLRRAGWASKEISEYDERYYREWAHEIPPLTHVEREVEVDLHHGILMRTSRLKPSAALLFEAAREVSGSRFKVLSPIDMVLHAMVHLFEGGEMDDALRELVDIDRLLRHFAATEPGFWETFWPRAGTLNLGRPAHAGFHFATTLLATPTSDLATRSADRYAPPSLAGHLMDYLVPNALFPMQPGDPARQARAARMALYVRSHWVKMPPRMLVRHLAFKAYLRFAGYRVNRARSAELRLSGCE